MECFESAVPAIFLSYAPTFFDKFCVAQSVEGWSSNLWVAGSNPGQVLLSISFMGFYKCIFGANVIDFEIFKTMIVIIF